jgi:hypothetical protein
MGLDPGSFINAEHDRGVGWVDVEAEDVTHLVDEGWVRRSLNVSIR